jgi:hypothetical protein
MMAQSPWQVGSELEWDHYAEQMHRYRCGERRGKPRVPWQYGTHINSLPIEHNASSANLPTTTPRVDQLLARMAASRDG